ALVVAGLAVAAPAYAADKVDVSVTPDTVDLSPGQATNLKVTVTNKTANDTSVPLTLSAPGAFGPDVIFVTAPGCDNVPGPQVSCDPQVGAGKTFELSVKIGAKATLTSVQPGEQKKASGAVKAALDGTPQGHAEAGFDVNLHGPIQAPSVPQVTGTVQDQTTGQPIKGAVVVLVDSGRCAPTESCEVGTDARGNFKFVSTAQKPITPGEIRIGATKDGYGDGQATITARAGQAAGPVILKLGPPAPPSATPTPDQNAGAGSATPGTGSTLNAKPASGTGGSSS